jgi:hypothetical protein
LWKLLRGLKIIVVTDKVASAGGGGSGMAVWAAG